MALTPVERRKARERRENHSAAMVRRWQDPDFAAKKAASSSAHMKKIWQDPQASEARRRLLAGHNRTAGMRAAASKAATETNNRPEELAKRSARMRETMKDPALRALAAGHARALALKINAKKRATRQVVPPGMMKLYKKLRREGVDRAAALKTCWRHYDSGAAS